MYLKYLFLCLFSCLSSSLFAAQSSASLTTPYPQFPSKPHKVKQFLEKTPVDEVVKLLPQDPEEQKEAIVYLIEMSAMAPFNEAGWAIDRLCRHANFDAWDRVGIWVLPTYRRLAPCIVDALAAQGAIDRIHQIAQQYAEHRWYTSFWVHDLQALEKCFMAGDITQTYMRMAGTKTLFAKYIHEKFCQKEGLKDGVETLAAACGRLSNEEFMFEIEQLIKDHGFKFLLWERRHSLAESSHPRIKYLHMITQEMEKRFVQWLNQAGCRPDEKRYFDEIYGELLEHFSAKESLDEKDKAVLLQMFSCMYTEGEFHHWNRHRIIRALVKLNENGVRPTTRLFPHDPTDNRTLFSEWLSKCDDEIIQDPVGTGLEGNFGSFFSLFTVEEFDAAARELISLPAFYNLFFKHGKYFKHLGSKKNQNHWRIGSHKARCFKALYHVGMNALTHKPTLFELLLPHIESESNNAASSSDEPLAKRPRKRACPGSLPATL